MKEDVTILPKEITDQMQEAVWPKGVSVPESFLNDIKVTMRHARIFIASREKMHPDGVKLYDDILTQLDEFYS